MHRVLERQLRKIGISADRAPTAEQWKKLLERVDLAYTEADQDRYTVERSLELSSTEMRKRFTTLRETQEQLVLASRKAGMADVATAVLHNVGNVLNSVNVSATIISDRLRDSRRAGLTKALALLKNQPQPGAFLDQDPRGQKLLPYLSAIDESLGEERDAIVQEAASLTKNIEHIKSVIGQQLAAARGQLRGPDVVERVHVDELLDDAVSAIRSGLPALQAVSFERSGKPLVVGTDRHKVTQILLNLLANARDAVVAREGARSVVLRTSRLDDKRIAIEVEDDGVGIAQDTLSSIFRHGFTTKQNGHGFGLHSSACAATELGGSLVATSNGPGCGATFRLVLPDAPLLESSH